MKFILALLALTSAAKIKAHSKSTAAAGWADSAGDGCDWYASYPDSCGNYDSTDGPAALYCIECGAAVGWVDTYGDGCDWYVGNEEYCGDYDPEIGIGAFEACDACMWW